MREDLHREVRRLLDRDYQFKEQSGSGGNWLRQGKCPTCGKKELYTSADHPWVLRCGRLAKCGAELHVKEIYPDLFESWGDRYEKTPEQPNAAADAYLASARGFELAKIAGWYKQESYYDHEKKIGSASVRFPLGGNDYWERLIDRPQRFGNKKAHFNAGCKYGGTCWSPQAAMPPDEIWIVEGIFDSIALLHHDIWAASAMSCNNYPGTFLKAVAEQCKTADRKRPKLVWALDGDRAGREYTRKWVERSRKDGWEAGAAVIPQNGKAKRDWNDLHLADRLKHKDLEEYRYEGALLIADSAVEKALLIYNRKKWPDFFFDYDNRLYWFEIDFGAYNKVKSALEKDNESGKLTDDQVRDEALEKSKSIIQIANCNPTALYYQANLLTDESWYYLRIDFPHDGASVKNTFTGSQLSSSSEFKKRLLAIAPGAVYTGSAHHLDHWLQRQLYGIKTVQTIDFIGYSKDHGAWVFNDLAVKDGRVVEINDEDFFDLGKLSLKSLNQSVTLAINPDAKEYTNDWVKHLWACFKAKGLVALAFWLGALYAEQIRAEQKSFPFLEVVGDPGAGKSTLVEFLWKLLGRRDYEGFDPSKSTLAARARNFAQVANMPVVLIESDRDSNEGPIKQKSFDWDELKTAYNGRSVRSTGVKNGGNDTREPPFRGAIVISQNATVVASDAVLQRIVHLHFDIEGHTAESKAAADHLERMPVEHVSGFILRAAQAEAKVIETFKTRTAVHEATLRARPDVKNLRIAKNHAQLMALFDALRHIVPISDDQAEYTLDHITEMARDRQQAINADAPIVQEFWELVDYLDGDETPLLNHSREPSEIAISLNHFVQVATDKRQQIPDVSALKKVLRTSRFRKFIDIKPVNSAIHARYNRSKDANAADKPTSVRCWVFKRA
jgi:hypothetical protein